mgnify:CR=1 FL=1
MNIYQIYWLGRRIYYFLRWYNLKVIREQAYHDYYHVFKGALQRIRPYITTVRNKRVLDVGCGVLFPQTLFFHSIGAKVTGIDTSYIIPSIRLQDRVRLIGRVPLTEATQRIIEELRGTLVYYSELRRIAEIPLNINGLDIRQMDVCDMVFRDETFDLVISNAVFEHIEDVETATLEIYRTMKKGAVVYIEIHLFPSLTGGHAIPYAPPGSQIVKTAGVPLWDHLRQKLYTFTHYPLNKLRERDYRRIFERGFQILEWVTEFHEPKRFLTPEIRTELMDYSEEELLKRSIVVILRKGS